MYSGFLQEPKLIGLAYDLEQEMQVRRQPRFLGSVIPVPNANLCGTRVEQAPMFTGRATMPRHGRIW